MEKYNRIMEKVWLVIGILIVIAVSYAGSKNGFSVWGPFYILAGLAFLMFGVKRFFNKRHAKMKDEQKREKDKARRKQK